MSTSIVGGFTHVVQNQRSFQPRPNQEWKKKYSPQGQSHPNQLETNNMVDEVPPYCKPCEEFHEEYTCPILLHNGTRAD